MDYLCFKLLLLSGICLTLVQLQFAGFPEQFEDNDLFEHEEDDLDLTHVNWKMMIPFLLQRQQLRLCLSIYQHDHTLLEQTPCEKLMNSGIMAYCDIGHVEDLSMTMRDAFGSMLFDTLQKCRPGSEIFGVRCRRRA
ncbi:uncharacterized protein LOC117781064 [Drosophila innubila]|uniref:uncharacterized protein LOC117781064 n=1 Tax=Drosophila innubila TaxID=198719 RepID=UPI00148C45D7|nr:uncharacterized protein LOC117781064 [Drosophila innubila]